MEMNKVLELALATYGFDMQRLIAIEEMSELTKELVKEKRGQDNLENIIEEIADVEIMLTQLKIHYGIKEDVQYEVNEKVARLACRLGLTD